MMTERLFLHIRKLLPDIAIPDAAIATFFQQPESSHSFCTGALVAHGL